jgi:hypothetical protein
MKSERYSMSFTTASLLLQESVNLASLFLELNDWNAVREKVISNNLLQARTLNTSKRICQEIISRLKTLEPPELDLLAHGTSQEQGYLLWLAVCRRYGFIGDFASEVLRERYISLKTDLQHEDFESFFDGKAEYHPEMDKITPATRKKLRQVLFNMMREADLLTDTNTIIPAILTPLLLPVIPQNRRREVSFFPAFDSDIKGVAR